MAHSYLLGCGITGMNIRIVSPEPHWPDEYYVDKTKRLGVTVEITDDITKATQGADVVATDTWVSMGDEAEKEKRIKRFKEYTVDQQLMSQAQPEAIFLHCLPAYYGYEVTKEVAYGSQSVKFDEEENRMWAEIAIMVTLCK
jgi:ornithine carbamoyltransferase